MGLGLAAQEAAVPPAGEQKPKRPLDTLALVDQARGLPPEFSSDLLLKLAGSSVIGDAAWKRELIEEAFSAGKNAQLPFSRTAWVVTIDARVNQQYGGNGLDGLALQTRAVEAMLILDSQKALSMFEEIPVPALPRLTCEDAAVPRLEAYYDTAAKVFERSFSAKQRENEDDLRFLERRIGSMQSPAHVSRVLQMIFDVQLSQEQRKRLLTSFAVALEPVSGSDRVFGPYEPTLVPAAGPEIAQAIGFIPALRAYIVRQVGGPRCSDTVKRGVVTPSVAQFNSLVKELDPPGNQFNPITEDESKPLKDEGSHKAERAWQSDRGKQVLAALRWLNHGNRMRPGGGGVLPWTLEERKSLEWSERCQDALKLIEWWRETEEASPEDYLIRVAQTYATLAELIPPGSLRETMMRRYLVFLETHYDPTGNRNLWFRQLRPVLSRIRNPRQDPAERTWLLEHLLRSNNPIIAAYARIEALLGVSS
jgi:hypothetical protein